MLLRAILAAIAVLVFPARPAAACPCAAEGPPCAESWKASAVFRGRVEAIERAAPASDDTLRSRTITFTVLEAFSGVNGRSTIQITTPGSPAACGLPSPSATNHRLRIRRSRWHAGHDVMLPDRSDRAGCRRSCVRTRTERARSARPDLRTRGASVTAISPVARDVERPMGDVPGER